MQAAMSSNMPTHTHQMKGQGLGTGTRRRIKGDVLMADASPLEDEARTGQARNKSSKRKQHLPSRPVLEHVPVVAASPGLEVCHCAGHDGRIRQGGCLTGFDC